MSETITRDIIDLTQKLLTSIASADWETYQLLCDPTLSAFEPEACGHLVEGMDFHRFYFELDATRQPVQTTLVQPHVRMLGDQVAIVSYSRLIQKVATNGQPETISTEETRIWQFQDGQWKHVHFHRSGGS